MDDFKSCKKKIGDKKLKLITTRCTFYAKISEKLITEKQITCNFTVLTLLIAVFLWYNNWIILKWTSMLIPELIEKWSKELMGLWKKKSFKALYPPTDDRIILQSKNKIIDFLFYFYLIVTKMFLNEFVIFFLIFFQSSRVI